MKEIKRIDATTVEIDGVKYYEKYDPEKPDWPTDITGIRIETRYRSGFRVNLKDQSKNDKISDCIDIARAINGDWEPDWEDTSKTKYCPTSDSNNNIDWRPVFGAKSVSLFGAKSVSFVWFPTVEACQHFIDYFGEIWLEAIV